MEDNTEDLGPSSLPSSSQSTNDTVMSASSKASLTSGISASISEIRSSGPSLLTFNPIDTFPQITTHTEYTTRNAPLRAANRTDMNPTAEAGECTVRILFNDFLAMAAKKVDEVMSDTERPLSKVLTRGEDAQFDQIIMAFGSVSERCLPSVLRTLFAWYDRQLPPHSDADPGTAESKKLEHKGKSGETVENKEYDWLQERRDLAIEYVFCLVLIEVLPHLQLHPGHDDLTTHLEDIAFKHFKYRESTQTSPNASNIHTLADLYAEVIGVLSHSRFLEVKQRFLNELKELRSKEQCPNTTQNIVSLLMGMKFFRIKMIPIKLFEASFAFLQECGQYFLEVKDKDIKHALAGLFVEILIPVASTVKNEVNVPCFKNFVEPLYSQTLDMCTKSKHRLAIFPLVTCLLCVSQKAFFLQNWHYFLAMCLSHLKNRDPKMARVALESLYRLLWVYMIRIRCESNSATLSRLQSIVNSLFPKGSKAVVPRDTPLNIFVKIIQFIAQERMDFAMREIVFDLLSVGRPIKMVLTPERMSIGLRAFLVVADSLQQKEGVPPMPRTTGVMPSGNTLRVKKTFLNTFLTEDTARDIGILPYLPHIKRVFVDILRALDANYGRPLMMTNTHNVNKEPDEMLTGERKPRIDLFRTCVAAVPRLMPEMISKSELIDLLSRLTVHVDEELRALSYQSLQTLVADFPDWRSDVVQGFTTFVSRDLLDTFPQLLDNGLRMQLQLLTTWKNAVLKDNELLKCSFRRLERVQQNSPEAELATITLHYVEALALVMLCNSRLCTRRLAIHILRELKCLLKIAGKHENDKPVIDILDKNAFHVLEKGLSVLPSSERVGLVISSNIDFQWIADRSAMWNSGSQDECNLKMSMLNLKTSSCSLNIWALCIFGYLEKNLLPTQCSAAVSQSWPIVYNRLHALFSVIDPTPVSDNRASLLRSSAPPRKPTSERDQYLILWRCYTVFAMRVIPPVPNPVVRCASPDLSLSSSPDNMQTAEKSDIKLANVSPASLYKLLIPLLRCEVVDVRDTAVYALSSVNANALKDLMEELAGYIREAIDKKQENMRRRRRRDALRLQLVKVFEYIAEHGTFSSSPCVLDRDTHTLNPIIIEYIDGARSCLEVEIDKDSIRDIKMHFCSFIKKMIKSFPLETYPTLLTRDLRSKLFALFASWSGPYGSSLSTHLGSVLVTTSAVSESLNVTEEELQFAALEALCSVLCCGPCFDQNILQEEGPLYPWLDTLLDSKDENVHELAYKTVILLLECNPDVGALLDWVVDRCYTAAPQIADKCFLALAAIFSAREYPCDHYTAIINVTLMCTGCPRREVHESALQLLQILDRRFFGPVGVLADNEIEMGEKGSQITLDMVMTTTYCCSQTVLSQQLSELHPELTMPMFSEITYRFQTARPDVRQLLLQYLLPWLHNMELVDPNISPANMLANYFQQYCSNELRRSNSRKEGWGSVEATEMVLNNLFYVTAKFSDIHPKEIEAVWVTLCTCWLNNMKVILRYLIIMSGMAPNELLLYAKRVTVYLARARPDRLLDELLGELQIVETLNCLIERTETPPFYRLTNVRKIFGCSDPDPSVEQDGTSLDISIEKGTIHTKRHSGEENAANIFRGLSKSGSSYGISRSPRIVPKNKFLGSSHAENEVPPTLVGSNQECHAVEDNKEIGEPYNMAQPHPLPMPEYGGYFSPLTEYLPITIQPSSGFHRCNMAVMLLADVVVESIDIDWSVHLPLILHIIFLGLDQARNMVHQHCKQLLLNLLIVLADHSDHFSVAQTLLNRKTSHLGIGLPPYDTTPHNFTEPDKSFDNYLQFPIRATSESNVSVLPSPTETVIFSPKSANDSLPCAFENNEDMLPPANCKTPIQNVVKALVDFIASRKDQVLWNYEDITAKVWSVKSVEQLDLFLQHVLRIFQESLPHALLDERWAQTALQLGLSCSSRHIAGRSLQVFRSLRISITVRMLSDILSRLVETVAEPGEDMQGYVTELLLTLESAVDSLDSDFRPLDCMKEIFKSTPNLNKDTEIATGKRNNACCRASTAIACLHTEPFTTTDSRARTTSYSISYHGIKKLPNIANVSRGPLKSETGSKTAYNFGNRQSSGSSNSRSAQSLKMLSDSSSQDDKMTILAQLFWLGVSILESDYEHEYLLALRLLNRVLHKLPLDRPDAYDKVEKIFAQLKWNNFQGVHPLLLKGCTNPSVYESVMPLLSDFIPFLNLPVVDPTQAVGFPLTIAALLPYMVLNYEDANSVCISAAEKIAQACTKKLENLSTVMTLYSRRTFGREGFQWTKCVIKYVHDEFPNYSTNMITFLVDVLEKGPSSIQFPVLSILHFLFNYCDLSTPKFFTTELLSPIMKQVQGPHYKEALKILSVIVARSSILLANPSFYQYPSLESHIASAVSPKLTNVEVKMKRELPGDRTKYTSTSRYLIHTCSVCYIGRTMDFTFDVEQMPIIGKATHKQTTNIEDAKASTNITTADDGKKTKSAESSSGNNVTCSPRRSSSLSPADNAAVGWKRPWQCQSRVRGCLVSLLTTCGQRVGLPKSPSVVFSQSSDLLERQSSMASSTEEMSGPDLSVDSRRENTDHFGVFKDFDFLEYESESVEGESTDNFNWGVRRRPLSAGEVEELEVAVTEQTLESSSEKTPLLTVKHAMKETATHVGVDDSSDEELESDEIVPANIRDSQSSCSSLHLIDQQEDKESTHSEISDSSIRDLADLTPCNTSPHRIPMSLHSLQRTDPEDIWRFHLCSLLERTPPSSLYLYHLVYKLLKEVVHKIITVTQNATSILSEFENTEMLQTHLTTVTCILVARAYPFFVWYDTDRVPLSETLRFGMLQLREHLDTLIDRKDHVNECIDTLKAISKLQQLRDETVTQDMNTEESVSDLARALYKFHFQLLLLLESVDKMYRQLSENISNLQLEDVSFEVIEVKKTLQKAEADIKDSSECLTPLSQPSALFADEPDSPLMKCMHGGNPNLALRYAKESRILWPSDPVYSNSDDDVVLNLVSLYSASLVDSKPGSYVLISENLREVHSSLMDELLQILALVNEMEGRVRDQKEKEKNFAPL